MKEDCQTYGILQAGNRSLELLGYKLVLPLRKEENSTEVTQRLG